MIARWFVVRVFTWRFSTRWAVSFVVRTAGRPRLPPGSNGVEAISLAGGATLNLQVTVQSPRRGVFSDELRLWTSDPAKPYLVVPLRGRVR